MARLRDGRETGEKKRGNKVGWPQACTPNPRDDPFLAGRKKRASSDFFIILHFFIRRIVVFKK